MKIEKSNCTETVIGKVKALKSKGLKRPTVITVEYQVNREQYEISESVKLRSEIIKLGFLPIGQKSVPVMGNTSVGSDAEVNYNPINPSEAFITKNIGKRNI